MSDEKYQEFVDKLRVGLIVKHNIWGEGVVVDMNEKNVKIQFGEEQITCQLKMLACNGVLQVEK